MLNIITEYNRSKGKFAYIEKLKKIINRNYTMEGYYSNPAILVDRRLLAKEGFNIVKLINKYSDNTLRSLDYSIKRRAIEFTFNSQFEQEFICDYYIVSINVYGYSFESNSFSLNNNKYTEVEVELYPYSNSRISSDDIIINKEIIERYDLL